MNENRTLTSCGQLRHVFDSPLMGIRLKLRLYIVAVCSLMTYGCEAWTLSEKVMRQLNGANSQMLSRITGQTVRQEARSCTTSHDILKHIRTMRMKYLGSILRGDPNSLTYCAVRLQYDMGTPGNLLMDAPPHENWTDLVVMTHDTAFWKKEQTRLFHK